MICIPKNIRIFAPDVYLRISRLPSTDMKELQYMLMTTVLLLLCSCGDDDKTESLLPQEEERHLISVSATTQDFTRAGEATLDDLKSNGFTVIAVEEKQDWNGGTYGVVYEGFPDTCTFTGNKYIWAHGYHLWPEENNYGETEYIPLSFFAFYPDTDNVGFSGITGTEMPIAFHNGNDGTVDVLFATITNATYETTNGVLDFKFEHLLTNVSVEARVTSAHTEEYSSYRVSATLTGRNYVEYLPSGFPYLNGDKWYNDSDDDPVIFTFEDRAVTFHTTDYSSRPIGRNYFLVPNNNHYDEYYELQVQCYGLRDGATEGTLLKTLKSKVNLSDCAGKTVVLNLNVDLHNDEMGIGGSPNTTLDEPFVRSEIME